MIAFKGYLQLILNSDSLCLLAFATGFDLALFPLIDAIAITLMWFACYSLLFIIAVDTMNLIDKKKKDK